MDNWLTMSEIAEDLRVPTKSIYAYCRRGEGPTTYRFGRHIRVKRVDYLAWEESRRTV